METVIRIMGKVYDEVLFPEELSVYFELIDNSLGNNLANIMLYEVLLTDENVNIQ